MMLKDIETLLKELKAEYRLIDTKDIIFRAEFLDKCKMNYCGRYNRSWSCPPAIGDIGALDEKVLSYPKAVLFQTISLLEDNYDVDGMDAALRNMSKIALKLNIMLNEKKADFMILSASTCQICDKCTYPENPCRHPDLLQIPMEALGIDVGDLSGKYNLKYYNGSNTVTYFSLCCFREN